MSQELFYREFQYQKMDMARFLAEIHGFDSVCRGARPPETKRTKLFFIARTFLDLIFLLKRRDAIRRYDQILALWHSGLVFMILKRLGLIGYDQPLWFGFSVHSRLWANIYRQIAKLDRNHTWFVVFTEQEIKDCAERLGIDPSRLLFILHGDWPQPIDVPGRFVTDPGLDPETLYYFTGGFTNRDYRPVIETFRKLGKRLIIVCSETNADVSDGDLPPNIQVYRDISFPEFALLRKASKAVIANVFRVIRDYVDPGVDGVLLKETDGQLEQTIQAIETRPERFAPIQMAASERFRRDYSQEALEQRMSGLIKDQWLDAAEPA